MNGRSWSGHGHTAALGIALAVLSTAGAWIDGAARAQTPEPEPTMGVDAPQSACVAIHSAWVGAQVAPVFLVGEALDITATLTTLCAARKQPLHIALVLDGSASMAGEPNRALRAAVREFIDRLNLKDNPATEVGVVSFNDAAKILCQLTNRASQASGCVGRVGASGGSNIAAGILAGLSVLRRGRATVPDPASIQEVMIVVTDGANVDGCPPVLEAADEVKSDGALLMTVCVSAACDAACVRAAATASSYHFLAANIADLSTAVGAISRDLNVRLRTAVIDHVVDPAFAVVPGSVVPPPDRLEALRLSWTLSGLSRDGITVSYRLRALSPATHRPVLRAATLDFTDTLGGVGHVNMRLPIVDVLVGDTAQPPQPGDLALAERSVTIAPGDGRVGDRFEARLRFAAQTTTTAPTTTLLVLRVPAHLTIESATNTDSVRIDEDGRRVAWFVERADGWPIALTATLRAVAAGQSGAAAIAFGPSGGVFDRVLFTAGSGPVDVVGVPPPPPPTKPIPTTPRVRSRIFLPLAVAEACLPPPPSDVVVVADTSTSMVERLPDGATKQDAAAVALGAMIDRLDFGADRFALVTFDRTAAVRIGFTADPDDVVHALRAAPLADGTSIDAGLLAAAALLGGPTRRAGARGIVVLVTDGRSYPSTPAAAVAAAAAAKAAGATVFAVGIGNEVDRTTLGDVASSAGHARFTGSAAEVRAAFEGVAMALRCARTAHWGGRAR